MYGVVKRAVRPGLGGCTALALYFVGSSIMSGHQSREVAQRSLSADREWRGTKVPWVFETPEGRLMHLSGPAAGWRVVLLGTDSCTPCLAQQRGFLRYVSERGVALGAVEAWIVSSRFVLHDNESSPQMPVRYLRTSVVAEGAPAYDSRGFPLALLVDSAGFVQQVAVGYVERERMRYFDDLLRKALIKPL